MGAMKELAMDIEEIGVAAIEQVEAAINGHYPCPGCASCFTVDRRCANDIRCIAWIVYDDQLDIEDIPDVIISIQRRSS